MCLYIGAKLGVCSSLVSLSQQYQCMFKKCVYGDGISVFLFGLGSACLCSPICVFSVRARALEVQNKMFYPKGYCMMAFYGFAFFHEQQDLREKIVTSRCNKHC